jgi:carbamoyl-phosphate synthase large subunit
VRANVQFAVHPVTGQRVVIEMNPRVSRSSALASKATGFPVAKISALLAIGYHLDEIINDITKSTPSCFEPALDYVVTKIPRFAFEKFPGTQDVLSTQMKSVGEVMGIGRTFKESFHKAILSLETKAEGFPEIEFSEELLSRPNSHRIYHIVQAMRLGRSIESIAESTQISPWFLEQVQSLVKMESELKTIDQLDANTLRRYKRNGFSDQMIARPLKCAPDKIRDMRLKNNILPGFSQVDTCAGEFKSETPYYYSTYWADRSPRSKAVSKDIIAVLGSGPNRIGQGIEFDYGCVRGVKKLQKENAHVVMINSNPETVSTDYDTSDELYFEPLISEHVSEVLSYINADGFVSQLGGQTPIGLAPHLIRAGFKMLGSSLESIDLAEDRGRFSGVCRELNFKIPENGIAADLDEAQVIAQRTGYPVICRPSYVLGGRRMEVVTNLDELKTYFSRHGEFISREEPCLIDQFLEGALEVDVDLVRGKDWTVLGGIVEHIEAAGVHSGDSMGVLPPQRLKAQTCFRIEQLSRQLADRLGTIGHLNLQLAIKNDQVYMLEANPRSSRSVPFISKATRIPIVDLGILAMLGRSSVQVKPEKYQWLESSMVSVKGVVFPFRKFRNADSILGPEMKSTGESMGRGDDYAEALLKASLGAHIKIPSSGEIFLSLRDKDKEGLLSLIRKVEEAGYDLSATAGTGKFLNSKGIKCEILRKVHEGRPHCVDRIRSGKIALTINTTAGRRSVEASFDIRRSCIDYSIPCITESHAAEALIQALLQNRQRNFNVSPIEKMI